MQQAMEHAVTDDISIRLGKSLVIVSAKEVINNALRQAIGDTAPPFFKHRAAPAIGEFWKEQGGTYIGILRDADGIEYHNVISLEQEFNGVKWGERGKEIAHCTSDRDGLANTIAMAEAGSELARDILRMRLNGFDDWALPARHQLRLAYLNAPESFDKESWYWSSTQFSAYGAWLQYFANGGQLTWLKDSEYRARAVRRFSVIE